MRIIVSIFLFILVASMSTAQVSLTAQLPPAGIMQKRQLWNVLLVNGSTTPVNVRVSISLLNTKDNRSIMTAASNIITVPAGAKQLKYDDAAPIQYNYMSPVFDVDLSPDGLLPIGNYIVCYSADVVNALRTTASKSSNPSSDNVVATAESCVPLEIMPLSPPVLNMPLDGSAVENAYPQFSWIPPAPLNLFNDLSYDIRIVKIMKGQSAVQALQQNIPEYSEAYVKNIFCNYPSSAKGLDTGITYAWGIIAKNNDQFVAQSDAWTFTVQSLQKPSLKYGNVYNALQKDINGGIAFCNNNLKMEYNNEAGDAKVPYEIISIRENKEQVVKKGTLSLAYGQNLIELPLDRDIHIKKGGLYLFKLTNSRKENWYTRFICIQKNAE